MTVENNKPNAYEKQALRRTIAEDLDAMPKMMQLEREFDIKVTDINEKTNFLGLLVIRDILDDKKYSQFNDVSSISQKFGGVRMPAQELDLYNRWENKGRPTKSYEGLQTFWGKEDCSQEEKDLYDELKKSVWETQNNDKLNKTPLEKAKTIGNQILMFMGNMAVMAGYATALAVKAAGKLVHITPAAYLINRLPYLTETATYEQYRDVDRAIRENYKSSSSIEEYSAAHDRPNFLQISNVSREAIVVNQKANHSDSLYTGFNSGLSGVIDAKIRSVTKQEVPSEDEMKGKIVYRKNFIERFGELIEDVARVAHDFSNPIKATIAKAKVMKTKNALEAAAKKEREGRRM